MIKKYLSILTFLTLLIGCSKEDPVIEKINLPPGEFEISLQKVSYDKATIIWEESIDPEHFKVTYTVLLNNEIKIEDTENRVFEFTDLDELTSYTSRVIAKDISGIETVREFSFTTKKYYLHYRKAYYYDFGGSQSSGAPSHMIRSSDGNYIISGISTRPDDLGSQSFVLKIDEEGNEIWKHFYGNHANQITNITESRDGGFIFVAYHHIFKIDSNGNEIWRTEHSANIHPHFTESLISLGEMLSVKEDSKGNIFVAGHRSLAVPDPAIGQFGVLTMFSSSGELIWDKEYRISYRSTFDDLLIDQNDEIIILGTIDTTDENSPTEEIDLWVVKTDNSGELIWHKSITTPDQAFAGKIIKTRDGNFVIAAHSQMNLGAIYKITAEGDEIWNSKVRLSSVYSVEETSDGDFVAVGFFDMDGGISRHKPDGTEMWMKFYINRFNLIRGKAIIQTEDKGFLIAASFKNEYYHGRIYVYKTDPEGNYEY